MTTGYLVPTLSVSLTPDVSEKYITYFGTLAVSNAAHVYVTGGVVLSFAAVVPHNSAPVWVDIKSNGPSSGSLLNTFTFVPGTAIDDGKVIILVANGASTGVQALQEFTNSTAFNSALIRADLDQIVFKATFRKGS